MDNEHGVYDHDESQRGHDAIRGNLSHLRIIILIVDLRKTEQEASDQLDIQLVENLEGQIVSVLKRPRLHHDQHYQR